MSRERNTLSVLTDMRFPRSMAFHCATHSRASHCGGVSRSASNTRTMRSFAMVIGNWLAAAYRQLRESSMRSGSCTTLRAIEQKSTILQSYILTWSRKCPTTGRNGLNVSTSTQSQAANVSSKVTRFQREGSLGSRGVQVSNVAAWPIRLPSLSSTFQTVARSIRKRLPVVEIRIPR